VIGSAITSCTLCVEMPPHAYCVHRPSPGARCYPDAGRAESRHSPIGGTWRTRRSPLRTARHLFCRTPPLALLHVPDLLVRSRLNCLLGGRAKRFDRNETPGRSTRSNGVTITPAVVGLSSGWSGPRRLPAACRTRQCDPAQRAAGAAFGGWQRGDFYTPRPRPPSRKRTFRTQ